MIKNKNISLCTKLKCEKRNLTKTNYNEKQFSYEIKKMFNKEEKSKKIKYANILNTKEKKMLFFLTNDELMIYDISEDILSLNIMKEIPFKELISNGNIKYYYIFNYKNNILFNIFNYRQINLFLFDYNKCEFILKKSKNYSSEDSNKCFYYMKKNNKFVIFKCDEAIIYDSLLKECKNIDIDTYKDNNKKEEIYTFKELNLHLLCLIFFDSISIYDVESEKILGIISDIRPKSVKLVTNIKGQKYLMILSLGDINIYNLDNLAYIKQLNSNELKNIQKIKQLSNLDICIIYGDYNLAFFDLEKNVIKYQIKNETINNKYYYYKYFHLKEIQKNIIIYNPTRYSLHIINYIKGQIIGKFSDGLNKIIKCKKINVIDSEKDINSKEDNNKFYYITNSKGFFIFKIKNL